MVPISGECSRASGISAYFLATSHAPCPALVRSGTRRSGSARHSCDAVRRLLVVHAVHTVALTRARAKMRGVNLDADVRDERVANDEEDAVALRASPPNATRTPA